MRDFNKILCNCLAELDSIGVTCYSRYIASITVNNRLSRALGRCVRKNGVFYIELARKSVAEGVDVNFIKNIIMYELIHTMPNCWNHGPVFQNYARIINRGLGYHVSTTETIENMMVAGVKPLIKSEVAKYALVCRKCGKEVAYRQRWCDLTANPGNYRHGGCGGDLKTISRDPSIAIVFAH